MVKKENRPKYGIFVAFYCRDDAVKAKGMFDGKLVSGSSISVSFGEPVRVNSYAPSKIEVGLPSVREQREIESVASFVSKVVE